MSYFQSNRLRFKLLLIVILTTLVLALYKTLLGNYLIGFKGKASELYQISSPFSLAGFSLVGFFIFYQLVKPFQQFYNLKQNNQPVPDLILKQAKKISQTVTKFAFTINLIFYHAFFNFNVRFKLCTPNSRLLVRSPLWLF